MNQDNSDDPYREERQIDFKDIITVSLSMQKLLTVAKQVAAADINVLITGETGTGKELMARALHNNSTRKNGPFIVVNSAGIPDTLLES